jgi:hypothetical protein
MLFGVKANIEAYHANITHIQEKTTYKIVLAAKQYNDSVLEKEIQQQKQRRAWEHGRQVDSAVVSPLIKKFT